MYPTVEADHNAAAQKLFTDHYRGKPIISGLLKSYEGMIQELEGVFWDIINKFQLANTPTGDQLRILGKIVGAPFLGESDAGYLAKIIVQIRVNRSQGLSEDLIQIATLSYRGSGQTPSYLDYPTQASFRLEALDVPSPLILASQLSKARSIGTRGIFAYSTWSTGNDFKFTSRYGGTPDEGLWGSRYDSTVGGLLVAGTGV